MTQFIRPKLSIRPITRSGSYGPVNALKVISINAQGMLNNNKISKLCQHKKSVSLRIIPAVLTIAKHSEVGNRWVRNFETAGVRESVTYHIRKSLRFPQPTFIVSPHHICDCLNRRYDAITIPRSYVIYSSSRTVYARHNNYPRVATNPAKHTRNYNVGSTYWSNCINPYERIRASGQSQALVVAIGDVP